MNTQEYALSVLLTALGGFDPAPMLILAAALGAGIRKRHIMGSAGVLLGGTAAWGMTLTLLVGPGLKRVNWWELIRHGSISAWIELVLALAIGGYAVWRVVAARRSRGRDTPEEKPATSPWALYVTAVVFVGIVIFDLPFDVHVATAASQPPSHGVAGWIAWSLISQFPLTLLMLLTILGKQQRFSRVMRRAWAAVSPWVNRLVTAVLGLAALLMLLDAGEFLLVGHFLVQ